MNNVSKHSRGNAVFLSLGKTQQTIDLEIRDNGLGFSPETLPGDWGCPARKNEPNSRGEHLSSRRPSDRGPG